MYKALTVRTNVLGPKLKASPEALSLRPRLIRLRRLGERQGQLCKEEALSLRLQLCKALTYVRP